MCFSYCRSENLAEKYTTGDQRTFESHLFCDQSMQGGPSGSEIILLIMFSSFYLPYLCYLDGQFTSVFDDSRM